MVVTASAQGRADVVARRPRHIAELHGLRGLALSLVVVFHLFGDGRVSGGVDVFLMVSGFLVTVALLRRADEGRLSLAERYGSFAIRLVPPALVVLAFVAVAAHTVLPPQQALQTGREIVASALYLENWELISSQLTYDAAGPQTSPVQHFWSLAVQGQFFLLWPIVVLVLAAVARRRALRLDRLVLASAGVATGVSFLWAVRLVDVDQQVAYFHSGARFWELGAGALLAVLLPSLALPGRVRDVLAWSGLGLVVASGLVVDGATHYPGPWALVPVGGAILVIVGSGSTTRSGPRLLLETAPLRFVARISYSLYLWHWPLLITYLAVREREAVGWRGAAVILGVSVLLAWATHALVEQRGRALLVRRGTGRGGAAALAATAAFCLVVGGVVVAEGVQERGDLSRLARPSADHPGAAVLGDGYAGPRTWTAAPRPEPALASKDAAPSNLDGCAVDSGPGHAEVRVCTVHEPAVPAEATATVVLLGASHVVQYEPAFAALGAVHDWEVLTVSKSGCHFMDTDESTEASCRDWNQGARERVAALDPDLVVVLGAVSRRDGPDRVIPSHVAGWRDLDAAGLRVLTVRDNPRFERSPTVCLREDGIDAPCGKSRREALAPRDPAEHAPDVPGSVAHVDLTRWICDGDACPAVVGNVLVYRDEGHLSATYVRSLAPLLDERLRAETSWLYADDAQAAAP
ncbi:acyltransferase family protein [Isoptericola halotolerans]|uniref:acyltransferase family protein n=1 Tax=Isoptericola halotolerans TaxID=300560 RepID=UPI00388D8043